MFLDDVIKRILKRKKTICKVYDTSAIRNYFEIFKEMVETKHEWLIVVPEGVLHEISVAKNIDRLCRIIYDYITTNCKLYPNFIVEVTEDSIRNWSVDEQVIHVVEKYQKKGYDAELISCDKEQCFRAELKKINCSLLPVTSAKNNSNMVNKVPQKHEKITVSKERENFKTAQIVVELVILNKEKYLKVNKYLSIYDNRGKRRIGKDGYVKFETTDKFLCFEKEYVISKIENNRVIFIPK